MDQNKQTIQKPQLSTLQSSGKKLSLIPLGGLEDVTRNMYLYEYENEILIVDCGIGFADETMLGVDLLLPDISYLLQTDKKIVGMVLTHGHEDHIGALPFILPQLPKFPIYATPLTAALANEKLREYRVDTNVQVVKFGSSDTKLGSFSCSFIRITHSVPDTSHIFIKTPAGNFYHGSDFKFDLTPADGKKTEFAKIVHAGDEGILCVMSDCLGSERAGHTPSEEVLSSRFEREMRDCKGKFIVTTYSSNISRLNQAIQAAEKLNRKVCFVGRSLIKTKAVGQKMGYLQMKNGTEIEVELLRKYPDDQILLIVAGSQGQENSAMTRIANGEHREIKLFSNDVVVFSSDPIPGNEVSVNALIDSIAKKGAKALYSQVGEAFHVSGHGSSEDLMLLMSLTRPRYLLPISGTYKQMVAYRALAERFGFQRKDVQLIENGQEIIFSKNGVQLGRKIPIKNVYVDQISGEEVETFMLRDRERLAKEGFVAVMAEIDANTGQIVGQPDLVARGFTLGDIDILARTLHAQIQKGLEGKNGRVMNWAHVRKLIAEITSKQLDKELRRRPLVLPIIIEV